MLSYTNKKVRKGKCLRSGITFFVLAITSFAGLVVSPPVALSDKASALETLKETIVHFDEASPGVYRGGRVPEAAAPLLKELGVKTVINFDNKNAYARKEEEHLKLFGIYTVRMPWSGFDYPKDEDIEKFLTLMATPDLKPIMVHCKRGSERTGTTMAIWRMKEFGWPVEKAYEEMLKFDYRRFRQGHLKEYVFEYAREHGDETAKIGMLERMKTKVLYVIGKLGKLNPS